jgi:hypothetical protein
VPFRALLKRQNDLSNQNNPFRHIAGELGESEADKIDLVEDFIRVLIEGKIRELDTPEGKMVHGSSSHIKSLETRIHALEPWRDSSAKGSEKRANYARLINKLKSELNSAKRAPAKTKVKKSK